VQRSPEFREEPFFFVAGAADRGDLRPGCHHGFPGEIYQAPETWARRAYPKLIHFHEIDKGGHFAAWEQPQLFAEELRAAFRSLRQ
jgi:pimeloyl-ACP methyl ester carboxylesterase